MILQWFQDCQCLEGTLNNQIYKTIFMTALIFNYKIWIYKENSDKIIYENH